VTVIVVTKKMMSQDAVVVAAVANAMQKSPAADLPGTVMWRAETTRMIPAARSTATFRLGVKR